MTPTDNQREAEKIFARHYEKASSKTCDEMTLHHMRYAINAMKEYHDQRLLSAQGVSVPSDEEILKYVKENSLTHTYVSIDECCRHIEWLRSLLLPTVQRLQMENEELKFAMAHLQDGNFKLQAALNQLKEWEGMEAIEFYRWMKSDQKPSHMDLPQAFPDVEDYYAIFTSQQAK